MKVSKVVMIVVALHVLVIGGIFVFEGCSRARTGTAQTAEGDNLPTPGIEIPPPAEQLALAPGLTPATPDAAPVGLAPTAALAPAPSLAPTPAPAATYAVKKGDSLWKIAKAQGTTVDELLRANNLTKTSVLQIGQALTIPAKTDTASVTIAAPAALAGAAPAVASSGSDYTVKSGDSLWKIANKNGTTVAALKQANGLSTDRLQIGQKLVISAGSAAVSTAGATPAVVPARSASAASAYQSWEEPGTSFMENGQTIHVIDFNESLGMIAAKYGVSTKALMAANNIADVRGIHPGQRLVIPSPGAAAPTADLGLAVPVVQTAAAN